jgi:hypothetical protein
MRTPTNRSAARKSVLKPAVLAVALASAFAASSAFAFNSGSTGADGALTPAVNTEIQVPESGILNYTAINIPAGVSVKFKKNSLNTPVYLLVSGDVTIGGLIDMRGEDARHSGAYADGSLADDGIPGKGAAGAYDGGRGGREDAAQTPAVVRGGAGLGPGGGMGGIEGPTSCADGRYVRQGGFGAAHGTAGGNAFFIPGRCATLSPLQPKAYGSALIQPLIGGSGGGGGSGGTNYAGTGGGGGGGALLIAASGTITLAAGGSIDATGGDSGGTGGTGAGGRGGGGSGGAIRLVATNIAGTGGLLSNGGCTNINGNRRQECLISNGDGYGGAPGRIRLEAEQLTYTGATSPAYAAGAPAPVFLASVPALRIASVAGTAVPPNPTGNADITLPGNVANPVTVNFETTNVPTGNTVLLKVIPAYGSPVEALSPAIAGTAAAGTASVQVNLPQGPSVLQAATTYTVVVAMGEALSRFAQNERVEKVQLIATLGGPDAGQAKLITVSGKEYMVPLSVLQMVGFTG